MYPGVIKQQYEDWKVCEISAEPLTGEGEHAYLSEQELESTMYKAAEAAGASVLSSHFHRFGPQQGVTGVLVLAESHITVHTWPEYAYSAFDVFMCGQCQPEKAVEVIIAAANTVQVNTNTIIRGTPSNIEVPSRIKTGLNDPEKAPRLLNQEH
jgi:S-adenosylmethionine decarboxylase